MFDIQDAINEWLAQGQEVALATVVETWGSAPRRQGAKMAVNRALEMVGSVSGGCVEGAVIEEMITALDTGKGRLLSFGVSDDTAWDVGLACGGTIKIFVEPLNVEWWQTVMGFAERDQRAVTVTALDDESIGQKIVFDDGGSVVFAGQNGSDSLSELATNQIMVLSQSGPLQTETGSLMVDLHRPRPHLIIIGGVHIAMALQNYAMELGFRVSIVDPRKAFATPARFPHVDAILQEYPNEALPKLELNADTYIAVLTHDPKIDDPALTIALPSDVPYIGVLSSARTHQKRVARLTEAGITSDMLERIHTPIGIDINAQTPEEIALCIMAEIVSIRNDS